MLPVREYNPTPQNSEVTTEEVVRTSPLVEQDSYCSGPCSTGQWSGPAPKWSKTVTAVVHAPQDSGPDQPPSGAGQSRTAGLQCILLNIFGCQDRTERPPHLEDPAGTFTTPPWITPPLFFDFVHREEARRFCAQSVRCLHLRALLRPAPIHPRRKRPAHPRHQRPVLPHTRDQHASLIQWSASPSASAISVVPPRSHSSQPGSPSVIPAVSLRSQQHQQQVKSLLKQCGCGPSSLCVTSALSPRSQQSIALLWFHPEACRRQQ
ncbi:hypothetical protein GJAV_G00162840 [Gymnothorax javanicus]|nr:hypothetical protein GJAV_G00162840 [Gymnothorax javanicus]